MLYEFGRKEIKSVVLHEFGRKTKVFCFMSLEKKQVSPVILIWKNKSVMLHEFG